MDLSQVELMLERELAKMTNGDLVRRLREALMTPTARIRVHEVPGCVDARYRAWDVFDIGVRDVVIVFAEGGFVKSGYPWGLSFRKSEDSGPSSCWHRSLEEYAIDSCYFDESGF
ncbi:MAG: hypothetical protein QNL33_10730 [Akkermansiaceae bacterium]|jgi:hypothetical protein